MDKNKKTFLVATVTIFLLMVFTYALTFILHSDGISFVKWILSPVLVLGSDSSTTLIAIIIFLIVIGGISNGLNKCGFMEYMLNKIAYKFGNKRYTLMAVMVFFFMALGSLIGSFEEVVPLVPIAVLLSKSLGFDEYTGIGMSLLAVGCGFAAGVFNPFTIGVAQELAGLPMFSGVSLRLFSFVCIYLLLMTFLTLHAKKIAKDIDTNIGKQFIKDADKEKALKAFASIMGLGLLLVLSSSVIKTIQDYTMIIIALMFLVSGIVSIKLTKTSWKDLGSYFKEGAIDIAPSVLLILMASSIRYTMEESGTITIILEMITKMARNMSSIGLVAFMYLICLILEVFVPSGSAKAFLLIPLLVPLANTFGISAQLCVLAYAFGDGFSNVFYPTNPALLISLGLVNMDYKDWFKYSWKFQALNLLMTMGILFLGLFLGY